MRRYRAVLSAEFAIEAENIVQARRAAKRVRATGEVLGRVYPGHDSRGVGYRVSKILETVSVRRAGGES